MLLGCAKHSAWRRTIKFVPFWPLAESLDFAAKESESESGALDYRNSNHSFKASNPIRLCPHWPASRATAPRGHPHIALAAKADSYTARTSMQLFPQAPKVTAVPATACPSIKKRFGV